MTSFSFLAGCWGPLKPEVISGTSHSKPWPPSNVLVYDQSQKASGNFWFAETGKTTGQGFILKVDNCTRVLIGIQIMNLKHSDWATRKFRVSGSGNSEGPWAVILEEELIHTLSSRTESLRNITFSERVEVQYLKFDLVSFWGKGGGLQYFAAVPYTGKSKSKPS